AEEPGADDVLALRAQIEGRDELEELGIPLPAAGELRRERGGRPRVHDVDLSLEAAGRTALALVVTGRCVDGGIDRQLILGRQNRLGEHRVPVGVDRIPDGERYAEETLSRYEPVAREPL